MLFFFFLRRIFDGACFQSGDHRYVEFSVTGGMRNNFPGLQRRVIYHVYRCYVDLPVTIVLVCMMAASAFVGA